MTSDLSGEFAAYRQRLQDSDEGVRRSAVLELCVIGQPLADTLLLEALADPSPYIRQMAADGLFELASVETIERLAEGGRLEKVKERNNFK